MKIPKSIDDLYLSDLSHRIRTLPPDEAASALLECGTIVLLAGHPEIAYLLFTNLLSGELKISEYSSLVNPLKSILPSLCYLLEIECPAIFSEQAMSIDEVEWYVEEKFCQYEQFANMDRWFQIPLPSNDWAEDSIHKMTNPTIDVLATSDRVRVYNY